MNYYSKSLLDRFIPITDWIQNYKFTSFKNDLRAGLTVGVLLIPQSMAYAMLAGLPPVFGLYASIIPLVIYTIFGTSRQLSLGPVAIISILIASGLTDIAVQGSAFYITLTICLTFFVGAVQLLMGVFRLGFLMNFISNPVLSGFTSAAAFIIAFSQFGNLMGLDVGYSTYAYTILMDVFRNISNVHYPTLLMGGSCIILILLFKWWKPKIPGPLIAVVASTFVVWAGELDEMGIAVLGSVKQGFPAPHIPKFQQFPFWELLPTIFAIAFLGVTQSIALAKAMVKLNPDYRIDSNQELLSLGLANMGGAFFNAFPVAGSFSRTAVNDENKAKTSVSQLISVGVVLAAVLFLIPLLFYLPTAVLAAIIITAVPGIIDIKEARFLWRVRKREFVLMIVTFLATLFLGILKGMGVGVLISLGIVLHRTSYPNIVMLGRLPNTKNYRDLERFPEALTQTHTIIVRIDASLYFANINYMKTKLEQLEVESGKSLNQLVIDAFGINKVDSSALHALKELITEYRDRDIEIYFAGVKGPVRDLFKNSGIMDKVGKDHFFLDINEAVDSLDKESEESSHLI